MPLPELIFYAHWKYADLRVIDPADSPETGLDLIAGYTRTRSHEVQIRLDFLDLVDQPNYDLYMALDTCPGGINALPIQTTADIEWDILLVIPATGDLRVYRPGADISSMQPLSNSGLRVVRDPVFDSLNISIHRTNLEKALQSNLSLGFHWQAFLTTAGSRTLVDKLAPASLDGPPPPPAQVLFVFWNSLPAYSPAQALRRWDGAHTGPLGGRHGLSQLLRSARGARIPIFLLDLKNPASLSALDFLGGLKLVQNMVYSGLLTLPDPLPGSLAPKAYDLSDPIPPAWVLAKSNLEDRLIADRFGLPASLFHYTPSGCIPETIPGRAIFIPTSTGSIQTTPQQISRWKEKLVIPIPLSEAQSQASEEGPTIEIRRALIQTALEASTLKPGSVEFLALGGDLASSPLGNPRIARMTFRYLSDHPWIKVLAANDILTAKPALTNEPDFLIRTNLQSPLSNLPLQPCPNDTISSSPTDNLLKALQKTPNNPAGEAAWQAYLSLFTPISPFTSNLPDLRANYLGQVGSLLAAADWASKPTSLTTCSEDPDLDGQFECILASQDFFSLFELDDGSLTFAFARNSTGIHQLIGPSSQFIVGASDPSTWDLSKGMVSDPTVIPGAFSDSPGGPSSLKKYQVSLEPNRLSFNSTDGTIRKTYQLFPGGLRVEFNSLSPVRTQIPLALDPWTRFTPAWGFQFRQDETSQDWYWEVNHNLRVEISSSAQLIAHSFTESQSLVTLPEDPNLDYPAGHYLPFPLNLIEVNAQEGYFFVEIKVAS